jgi:hypothetical protein
LYVLFLSPNFWRRPHLITQGKAFVHHGASFKSQDEDTRRFGASESL